MRVCLFEDAGHAALEPLTTTRPIFDLRCGLTTLGQKQAWHFAPCDLGVLIRADLAPLHRLLQPGRPVNDLSWLHAGPTLFVNARWLPPPPPAGLLPGPCVAMVGGEVAFAFVEGPQLTTCTMESLADCLDQWPQSLPCRPAGGELLAYPWQLVERNASQIERDFHHLPQPQASPAEHANLSLVGPRERVWIDPSARLDPLVVIDATGGPVVIEAAAEIQAFTRLEGPCAIGAGTQVLGAKIRAGTTLGPQCRIGGEVECSIVQGYSNKYHDGFLGHAFLGEWVNLGAGTHNSDLRNDYGAVSVVVEGKSTSTGLSKVGCFIGDHAKTGLGTLLNTGTSIGAFCNVLPAGGYAPKYVPPFANYLHGGLCDTAELAQLLTTAGRVMGRRGVACTREHAELYRGLYEKTATERRRALREHEQRRLRRSA